MQRHGYEEPAALAAASAASGSVGRALLLASGELAAAREAALALLAAVTGARDTKARLEGAKGLLDRKAGGGTAGKARRQELAHRLRALASLLRDVTLLASGADRVALANPDLQDRFAALARPAAARWGVTAFATVDEALAATERNASPKVVADLDRVSAVVTGFQMSESEHPPFVSIKFDPVGRVHRFLLPEVGFKPPLQSGEGVVVTRDGRKAFGTVARSVPALARRGAPPPPSSVVLRRASEEDITARLTQQHREREMRRIATLKSGSTGCR